MSLSRSADCRDSKTAEKMSILEPFWLRSPHSLSFILVKDNGGIDLDTRGLRATKL